MDLTLQRSTWSTPPASAAARALDHHVQAYADWLGRAGAEPRLALVLCSGPSAREALVDGLGMHRIEVVHAPSTPARPVHPLVSNHQGDHFNTKLFLVDGFEAGDPQAVLESLDGQKGMLRRMATWVALVVDRLSTLEALERHAPGLLASVQRRVLVLDEGIGRGPAEDVAPDTLARWRRADRVAELAFREAMATRAAPTYDDFSRLVRAGYAACLTGQDVHPERQRLAQLWWRLPEVLAGEIPLPFPLDQGGPAVAEAVGRHAPSVLDAAGRATLAAALKGDAAATFAAGLGHGGSSVLDTLGAVQAMGAGEADHDAHAIGVLSAQSAAGGVGPGTQVHIDLALAAAAAAEGDVEGCDFALTRAAERAGHPGVAPELRFDVLEKRGQLHAHLNRRGPARNALDALELLAPKLASPFYAARLHLARGDFIAPLDPTRARTEYVQARALFDRHGYADWADQAADALDA